MTSSLWYELAHSSPWASDAGLEERHKELAARDDVQLILLTIHTEYVGILFRVLQLALPCMPIQGSDSTAYFGH